MNTFFMFSDTFMLILLLVGIGFGTYILFKDNDWRDVYNDLRDIFNR